MFRGYVLMCFTFGILFSRGFVKGDIAAQEIDLKKKLLADYDPSLPPILYAKDDYYSLIKFNIYRIRELDERKGEFIVEGQILLAWIDERFTWENSQVTEIRVSSKAIWMPSVYIYNAIEPEEMTLEPLPVIIQRGVLWAPRYTIRTRCIPNLRYYPFDKNVCDIVIAPRNIEEDFLSINTSSQSIFYKGLIKTKVMLDNPRWDYDDPKIYVKKIKIDNDFERDVVVYSFSIQRSMPLIPLGILTPCMACSLIFLTTFWMEAGSTLRAGLCVTSTLVCSSCLFTLSKILPASGSSTPIIGNLIKMFKNLRTYYRKEKMKIKNVPSGSSGVASSSKWVHFNRMSFLDEVTSAEKSMSNFGALFYQMMKIRTIQEIFRRHEKQNVHNFHKSLHEKKKKKKVDESSVAQLKAAITVATEVLQRPREADTAVQAFGRLVAKQLERIEDERKGDLLMCDIMTLINERMHS